MPLFNEIRENYSDNTTFIENQIVRKTIRPLTHLLILARWRLHGSARPSLQSSNQRYQSFP
jgi:hypothetical protein